MNEMTRRSFLRRTATGAAALAAPAVLARAAAEPDAKLNFLFILIDDMGWMDLSCQGSKYYETPNTDALAASGVRFTNAYAACPVCSPTRASILTGKYPATLHLTDWIPGHGRKNAKLRVPKFNQELPLTEVTLAEALKPAGYVSAAIGKWHLGGEDFYPEKQGFDLNLGGTHKGQPPSYFAPYKIPTLTEGAKGEYLTDRLTDEAMRWMETNKDRPFFLYLSHFAVHTPIQARAAAAAKYKAKTPDGGQKNAVYAAMVESVDQGVGRIMKKLEDLKIADRTVVIFMSDNGGLAGVTSNAPLRAGKGTLYEGGIREPMFIRWPGVTRPGTTCDAVVTSIDFYPTILAMAGVKCPDSGVEGLSLVPLLKRTGKIDREAIYWHYPHYHRTTPGGAIRRGDLKLIEYYEDGKVELYDLAKDLSEENDLAATMPDKAAELRKKLDDWRKAVNAQMPAPNPDYKPVAK